MKLSRFMFSDRNIRNILDTVRGSLHRHPWRLAAGLAAAAVVWGPTVFANLSTAGSRYDLQRTADQDIPYRPVAIVFGAGLYANGQPTPYLQWRVETAARLYRSGRVSHLLLTGDNNRHTYDEPSAMAAYAEKLGVPQQAMKLDYAGFNTYDSCYQAEAIFQVHAATLVTQGYHLPRAVLACRDLGIQTIGVGAVAGGRDWKVQYISREWLSTDKIAIQLLFKPRPTLLGASEPVTQ